MLDFIPLTLTNCHVYLDNILASEEMFPPNLQETADSYLDVLSQERSIGIIALHNGQYAGNAVGFCPLKNDRQTLCLDQVPATVGHGLIYLFNIVVDKEYQRLGLGSQLLRHFITLAKAAGYQSVGGHFRGNRSEKNFRVLGAKRLGVFDNWFDSGETFVYYELPTETIDPYQVAV